ncbi:MAG: metallophosphoesterase family protein [Planctomycetota bacterium]
MRRAGGLDLLIGILSDSHGRAKPVRAAVELFDRLGVEHVIHCGDVGGIEVFDELLGQPLTFVWGNTDVVSGGTLAYLRRVGVQVPGASPARLTLCGRTFAVFHGHEGGFEAAPHVLGVDYVLHGHTHAARDERIGSTRIINPGALHRATRKTVATLHLPTDELRLYEIGDKGS